MALTTVSNAGLGGSIDLTAKVTGTLPIANGGTNSTSTTFVNLATNITGTTPIANGGTAATTLAAAGLSGTPSFLCTMSTDQTSISDGVITKVAFDTEIYDTNSAYDKDTNYRFTVPADEGGKYYIYTKADCSDTTGSNVRSFRTYIYKNGSEYGPTVAEYDGRDNPQKGGAFMAGSIIELDATDYVEAYARIDTQNSEVWTIDTYFSVFGGWKLII